MALSTMWRGARRGLLSLSPATQQQGARAASTFANVPLGPPDPIFGLTDAFNKVRTYVICVGIAWPIGSSPCDDIDAMGITCTHRPRPVHVLCLQDTSPKKVSLGVGAYRDDKGKVR